jgi:hypothetical protein
MRVPGDRTRMTRIMRIDAEPFSVLSEVISVIRGARVLLPID